MVGSGEVLFAADDRHLGRHRSRSNGLGMTLAGGGFDDRSRLRVRDLNGSVRNRRSPPQSRSRRRRRLSVPRACTPRWEFPALPHRNDKAAMRPINGEVIRNIWKFKSFLVKLRAVACELLTAGRRLLIPGCEVRRWTSDTCLLRRRGIWPPVVPDPSALGCCCAVRP